MLTSKLNGLEQNRNLMNNFKLFFFHAHASNKIVMNYLVDVKSQLEVRSLSDGSLIQKIDLPPGAIDSSWAKKTHYELFIRVVSFISPGIIYRVNLRCKPYKAKIVKEIILPGLDATKFVTEQVFYPSYDGTVIPMFIIHRKDFVRNSNASTVLYGYGGFDVNILPAFSPSRILFLQNMDGVYAVANIRGGGSENENWFRLLFLSTSCFSSRK